MARKDLLKGLMEDATSGDTSPAPSADTARVNPAKPRYTKGAIGAVSQSIADLKAKAVIDIDPHMIDAGGLLDRIEYDDAAHEALKASLQEYGQQVPILVRPSPDDPARYQIVYGRRRVLALRDLNMPAKALVKDLDDRALVMAQGQENSVRKDLTFIEKANFAYRMAQDNYDRKIIGDALSADKTAVSKMLSVMDRIDFRIVQAIGPADGIGRERWMMFADHLGQLDAPATDIAETIREVSATKPDVERFEAALYVVGLKDQMKRGTDGLLPAKARQPREVITSVGDREKIATVQRKGTSVTVTLSKQDVGGFEEWLVANLRALHARWENEMVDDLTKSTNGSEQMKH